MSDALQRMIKKLEGDGPIEKHILLLKLSDALENAPDFGDTPVLEAGTPQRQWFARVNALLGRLDLMKGIQFRTTFGMLRKYWLWAITEIKGQIADTIEEMKLELELDGRSEIGNAYAPGDVYQFFADLKTIINAAEHEIMLIDPYFNGIAFDEYLSNPQPEIAIRILADSYSDDIRGYVEKHQAQFQSNIELRRSKELHDRIVFIDQGECWVIGGSIKDAGKKPTYLIPLAAAITEAKSEIYTAIWERAEPQN